MKKQKTRKIVLKGFTTGGDFLAWLEFVNARQKKAIQLADQVHEQQLAVGDVRQSLFDQIYSRIDFLDSQNEEFWRDAGETDAEVTRLRTEMDLMDLKKENLRTRSNFLLDVGQAYSRLAFDKLAEWEKKK